LTCMKRWEAFDVHEDVKGGRQRERWKAVGMQKEVKGKRRLTCRKR